VAWSDSTVRQYMVNMRRREVGSGLRGAMRAQRSYGLPSQGVRIAILGCIAGSVLAIAAGHNSFLE